jgi:hypothetical protein
MHCPPLTKGPEGREIFAPAFGASTWQRSYPVLPRVWARRVTIEISEINRFDQTLDEQAMLIISERDGSLAKDTHGLHVEYLNQVEDLVDHVVAARLESFLHGLTSDC